MRVVLGNVTALFVGGVVVLAGLLAERPAPVAFRVESTYTAERPQCEITDDRLGAVSGLVAAHGGVWAVNDTGSSLYRLDDGCRVTSAVDLEPLLEERGVTLRDVEDLVAAPDGWLWLADTGGNREPRRTVQLVGWNPLQPDRIRVVLLDYPSGTHDTEALLIGAQGRAVLVTKDGFDPAAVFSTTEPLVDGARVALVRRGTVDLVPDGEPRDRVVTGAAVSDTGVFVMLRTYSGGWEFDVGDGDIAAALVGGTPRPVPLPESRQGEAVTYTEDGTALLATSEGLPAALDRVAVTRRYVEGP